jgi:hypothetical protein
MPGGAIGAGRMLAPRFAPLEAAAGPLPCVDG